VTLVDCSILSNPRELTKEQIDTYLTPVLRSHERQRSEKPPKTKSSVFLCSKSCRFVLGGFLFARLQETKSRRSFAVTPGSSQIGWKHVPECANGRRKTIVSRGRSTSAWNVRVETSEDGPAVNVRMEICQPGGFAKYRRNHRNRGPFPGVFALGRRGLR
jgi:hypothetical protein